jgi:hypothetical protein
MSDQSIIWKTVRSHTMSYKLNGESNSLYFLISIRKSFIVMASWDVQW